MTATLTDAERRTGDFQEFNRNAAWVSENLHLLQEHLDQYIAVANREVVGVAFDTQALHRRFDGRRDVYITRVGPPDLPWVL